MNTDSQHLQQVSEEFQHMVEEFFLVQSRYSAAIKPSCLRDRSA